MLHTKTTDGVRIKYDPRIQEAFIAHNGKLYYFKVRSLTDLAIIENLNAEAFALMCKAKALGGS